MKTGVGTSMNENGPYRLIYWNAWYLVGAVWEELECIALLEEMC